MLGSTSAIAKTDGCGPDPQPSAALTPSVSVQRWSGCTTGVDVQLVTIAGWGHEWPTAPTYDATAAVLDFFGIRS